MSWLAMKSRLESRLILSAEVGQALLQRHEAYVRQLEKGAGRTRCTSNRREASDPDGEVTKKDVKEDDLESRLEDSAREKAQLEKRLNQALVNNEVTEISNKTILQELQDARETISRLTAHHARSIGWDTRLSAAMKEREDMQQERDSETHRARLAESRFAALKDKTNKLQAEVRRLQDSLEEKRLHRLESSESIIQDARSRIESVRKSQVGVTAMAQEDELTKVLESLVNDSETLKRDNAELQRLLTESREDLHALQEEVDEQRANPPPSPRPAVNPSHTRHFSSSSLSSIKVKDLPVFGFSRRNPGSDHGMRINIEPPPSPARSVAPSDSKRTSFSQHSPLYASSHVGYEIEEDAENGNDASELEKTKGHKPLLLLARSRGVQTDPCPERLTPLSLSSHLPSPSDPRSESSSYSESVSSHVSILLERIVALLNRMAQADALTLTNRLKRQHLRGADVGHLSRSTVSNILSEVNGLRTQFRFLLEDDKVMATFLRKDLRVLFKIFKDTFTELGQMRVTLNDVILDPSTATKISELALNPSKVQAEVAERGRENAAHGGPSWMAPISKLFSQPGRGEAIAPPMSRSTSGRASSRPRFAPKLGPALAASTTTVNVEFSGIGVGRPITSTVPPVPVLPQVHTELPSESSSALPSSVSAGVMGIFAGAPRPAPPQADPWVVVPKGPQRAQSSMNSVNLSASTSTIGRSTGRRNANRLSRNVDAIIDVEHPQMESDEEADTLPPLMGRTLHRRGLSDSSIHSTFTSHAEELPSSPNASSRDANTSIHWPDRNTVFQALSRTVHNFRMTASGTMATIGSGSSPSISEVSSPQKPVQATFQTPKKAVVSSLARPISPSMANLIPNINLSSWAASTFDTASPPTLDPFVVGSLREETLIHRSKGADSRGHGHDRDFV